MMYFKSSLLDNKAIKHAFFSRKGGTSKGLFSSLNFIDRSLENNTNKIADNIEDIKTNLKKVAQVFSVDPQSIKTIYQIHSAEVCIIGDSNIESKRIQADSIVTNINNVVIGIKTADCCPILLSDTHNNVIAAVHAGWRGAFSGVIKNTINSMCKLGSNIKHISACLGPTIAQNSYEVDIEFYNKFITQNKANEKFFKSSTKDNHYMFDLPVYVTENLIYAGIENTDNLKLNTYTDEENFFSCRRAFHKGEPTFGCQLSAIMLRKM